MQRVILSLITFALLLGCASTPKVREFQEEVLISGIELKTYANQGFLYTPYSYTGEYKPIGVVFATMTPYAIYEEAKIEEGGVVVGCDCWKVGKVSTRKVLDSLFYWAKSEGADAIVDLKITNSSRSYSQYPIITNGGINVTGFAIKRE